MNFEIFCAGMFNQRVVVEELQQMTDSFGQAHYGPNSTAGNWVTVIECWAKISPTWGQELRQSGREISELWCTIDLRYGSAIAVQPRMRLRHKKTGVLYDIRAVAPIDFARKVTELTCMQLQ
jgi:SPP1 family predicted phage head-tail adaptor